MNDALLEIGCEELPVSYIEPALEQMKDLAQEYLQKSMLVFKGNPEVAATPRRLVLYLRDVADKSDQKVQRIAGPPERMLKDDNGDYTLAAVGFSKKVGVPVEQLQVSDGKIYAEVKIGGEKAKKILQEVFKKIIENIRFPKTMVWEKTNFRFARPIRHILALLGSDVLRFEIAGIKSGKSTVGLYALSTKRIEIISASKYFDKLENYCIRVKPADRKKYIAALIKNAVPSATRQILHDEALLHENCFLVETPSIIIGEFDRKYLSLPREVLITCLKVKQKFFTMVDKNGTILPMFLGIRNGRSEYQSVVKEGYERVLAARLEDARFFYEQDKETSLDVWIEKLKGVTFHEQLGTLYDKTERMEKICAAIVRYIPVDEKQIEQIKRAVRLSKADLVSLLVYEYPELQGTAGRIYAGIAGESDEVCRAIEDHYKPAGQEDNLPSDIVGSVAALTDKVDSLVGYFVAGVVPSGNKDPFGLRRIALGIIRIILDTGLRIDIKSVIVLTVSLFSKELQEKRTGILYVILDFIRQRMEVVFGSYGFAYDEINAVLESTWNGTGSAKDMSDVLTRLNALKKIRALPDFEAVSTGYKRADNICKQAKTKGLSVASAVQDELFENLEEQKLLVAFNKVKDEWDLLKKDIHEQMSQDMYEKILNSMVSLRKPLDSFFETVMVMVDNEQVRANRLALLNNIVSFYHQIADFSQIVTK